jgi:hypothetical protein
MRIITCAGFYRTGSSAVTDFFSEFENCKSLGIFEFRFVQDPDGISDLEYNICENPHRHNTSHAIKRFLKYSRFLNGCFLARRYSKYFGDNYLKFTEEYINEITQLKCNVWWHRDQIDRGNLFYYLDKTYAKVVSLFNPERFTVSTLKNEKGYFTSISKEEFYVATKKYINRLIESAMKDESDYVMIDQLVPPTNIERYLNYFDDLKVVCVERDPRDLYVLEKSKYRWGIMPYKDVYEFCEWYRITRSHYQSPESDNILYINFEDLVYHYDETTKRLMKFVDLHKENHKLPKTIFIPEQSMKNTKLFESMPKYAEDVKIIEKCLADYLYKF